MSLERAVAVSKLCVALGVVAFGVFVLVFALTPADAHPVSACPVPGKFVYVAYGTRPSPSAPAKGQKIRVYVQADDFPSAVARLKVIQPAMTVDTVSVLATVDGVVVEATEEE